MLTVTCPSKTIPHYWDRDHVTQKPTIISMSFTETFTDIFTRGGASFN